MGVLKSSLFINGDQGTVKKLEDCATGQPSEVLSHFTIHQIGEHIKKIQEALKSVQNNNPALGITKFSVNGIYDQEFSDAIRIYKTKRDIRNFANKIDDIVGIKTIRSLDQENKSDPSPTPPTPLPEVIPDATESRLVFKKTFEEKFIVRNAGDLGSDFATLGEVILQLGKDIPRMLKNPIEGSDFDDGKVQSKLTGDILATHVMKFVNKEVEVRRLPNVASLGMFALQMDITRQYRYSYGPGSSTDRVIVITKARLLNMDLRGGEQVVNSTDIVSQPTNFIDPR